ncbi:MAG: hypothetical protein AAB830_02340 [Patescibacteria group bacterium]
MHDHNNGGNKDSGHKGMMWMMIPCLLLLGFLFFSGGKLSSSGYFWPLLIGIFVAAHIWMMFKGHDGHGGHSDTDTEEKTNVAEDSKTKDGHKKGGCCH